jgi:hypothetical protein
MFGLPDRRAIGSEASVRLMWKDWKIQFYAYFCPPESSGISSLTAKHIGYILQLYGVSILDVAVSHIHNTTCFS